MQTEPISSSKTGPKPKELVEGTILGLLVGRDKTVVPPEQVEELAALGCSNVEIANFFGVKEQVLRYNFHENLIKGREVMKVKLRRAMFKNACEHMNAAVQIFLSKNILCMADVPVNSAGNEPLPWTDDVANEVQDALDIEPIDADNAEQV